MRSVNLNDLVCFRLTDAGALIVGRHMQEHNEDPIYKRFADGTCQMQLWRLMEVFGPHLSHAADPPFKDNTLEFP